LINHVWILQQHSLWRRRRCLWSEHRRRNGRLWWRQSLWAAATTTTTTCLWESGTLWRWSVWRSDYDEYNLWSSYFFDESFWCGARQYSSLWASHRRRRRRLWLDLWESSCCEYYQYRSVWRSQQYKYDWSVWSFFRSVWSGALDLWWIDWRRRRLVWEYRRYK
jgi:hypothetical protein